MFGLGNDDSVETITVDWPNGKRSQSHGLKADQHYILIEPQPGVAGRVVLIAK